MSGTLGINSHPRSPPVKDCFQLHPRDEGDTEKQRDFSPSQAKVQNQVPPELNPHSQPILPTASVTEKIRERGSRLVVPSLQFDYINQPYSLSSLHHSTGYVGKRALSPLKRNTTHSKEAKPLVIG